MNSNFGAAYELLDALRARVGDACPQLSRLGTALKDIEASYNGLLHRNRVLRVERFDAVARELDYYQLLYKARNWVQDSELREKITQVCPPIARPKE